MFRFRRRRLLPDATVLRLLVLGLVAIALLMRPVLASFGEAHELAHDPSGMHAHVEHTDAITDELASDERGEEGAATLHTLLHLAHCCGQSTAATPPALPLIQPPLKAADPALADSQRPAAARIETPFRPPIAV
jgi:hypothetical protein